jgi:hypothetical protein
VHGTGVYSAGVGPKGPALERFLDIKKKKKNFRCTWVTLCAFNDIILKKKKKKKRKEDKIMVQ